MAESIQLAQIYLFDSNLHILFAQERLKTRTFLSEVRELISSALHNRHSHVVYCLNTLNLFISLFLL